MAKKIFVLDTNVLAHEPKAILAFEDNNIVIPIIVIEELDKIKKGIDEVGRNARQTSRALDNMRKAGKLSKGIKLPNGGTLKVLLNHMSSSEIRMQGLDPDKADSRILAVALHLHKDKQNDLPVILISKDTNLRIKADALGLRAEDFESDKVSDISEQYSGLTEASVTKEQIDTLHKGDGIDARGGTLPTLVPNQFVMLKNGSNCSQSGLARYDFHKKLLVLVRDMKSGVWGIKAKNREQHLALDLLLNDDIRLVTLVGKAGTGKTILALAAGLEKTLEAKTYSRLVVSRPVFPMGKDVGFLPGEIGDKMRPWMQPIRDNLEFLMGESSRSKEKFNREPKVQSLFDQDMIEVEPLMYIRGRSMPHQYLIVDEAQNLTPHEIKTIITRAGEGTKVVLTGDPFQIDNPYLDSSSNGLSFIVEKFKTEPIAGHITLIKGERSELAELAATIL